MPFNGLNLETVCLKEPLKTRSIHDIITVQIFTMYCFRRYLAKKNCEVVHFDIIVIFRSQSSVDFDPTYPNLLFKVIEMPQRLIRRFEKANVSSFHVFPFCDNANENWKKGADVWNFYWRCLAARRKAAFGVPGSSQVLQWGLSKTKCNPGWTYLSFFPSDFGLPIFNFGLWSPIILNTCHNSEHLTHTTLVLFDKTLIFFCKQKTKKDNARILVSCIFLKFYLSSANC